MESDDVDLMPSATPRRLSFAVLSLPPRCCTAAAGEIESGAHTRLRARVAYDGTNFHGWQYQSNAETVQGVIESALFQRFRRKLRIVGASRTDTGVHARGQAAHIDVPLSADEAADPGVLSKLQYALNKMLPRDIRLSDLQPAPPPDADGHEWNAMYASRGKLYSYRISTRRVADPLSYRQRADVYSRTFDERRLSDAMHLFVGQRDFAAFANLSPAKAVSTIRTISSAKLIVEAPGHLRLDFHLDGALYKMVRNVVGALLAVANGVIDADDFQRLFLERDRCKAPMAAPACGLCLEHVFYDDF